MISELAHLLDGFLCFVGFKRRCIVFDVHVFLVCTAGVSMVLWPTLVYGNPSANVSCSPLRLNC